MSHTYVKQISCRLQSPRGPGDAQENDNAGGNIQIVIPIQEQMPDDVQRNDFAEGNLQIEIPIEEEHPDPPKDLWMNYYPNPQPSIAARAPEPIEAPEDVTRPQDPPRDSEDL